MSEQRSDPASSIVEELRQAVIHFRPWMTYKTEDGYPAIRPLRGEEFADALLPLVDRIAQERVAEARAPFLALAEEYERHAGLMQAGTDSGALPDVVMRSQAFRDAAASIRRAAEGVER